jgi:hypothetical protein
MQTSILTQLYSLPTIASRQSCATRLLSGIQQSGKDKAFYPSQIEKNILSYGITIANRVSVSAVSFSGTIFEGDNSQEHGQRFEA